MTIFDEVWFSSNTIEKILSVLSISALVIGIIGNVTVCVVICYSRSIYTTTNVYLLSLATADLLFLIVHVSRETYYYANYSEIKVENYESPDYGFFICLWIFKTAKNASSFTITAFTSERYLAICRPFIIQTTPRKSRVNIVLAVLWLVAALLSLNSCSMSYILFKSPHPEWKQVITKIGLPSEIILALLNFVIPMVSITVMYILIGIELRKTSEVRKNSTRADDDATRKALKMFVFIVVAFALCWAPYYVAMIMKAAIFTGHDIFGKKSKVVFYFDTAQKFTRTAYPILNPLIYTMMSQKFRDFCKDQLTRPARKFFISAPSSNVANIPKMKLPLKQVNEQSQNCNGIV